VSPATPPSFLGIWCSSYWQLQAMLNWWWRVLIIGSTQYSRSGTLPCWAELNRYCGADIHRACRNGLKTSTLSTLIFLLLITIPSSISILHRTYTVLKHSWYMFNNTHDVATIPASTSIMSITQSSTLS